MSEEASNGPQPESPEAARNRVASEAAAAKMYQLQWLEKGGDVGANAFANNMQIDNRLKAEAFGPAAIKAAQKILEDHLSDPDTPQDLKDHWNEQHDNPSPTQQERKEP